MWLRIMRYSPRSPPPASDGRDGPTSPRRVSSLGPNRPLCRRWYEIQTDIVQEHQSATFALGPYLSKTSAASPSQCAASHRLNCTHVLAVREADLKAIRLQIVRGQEICKNTGPLVTYTAIVPTTANAWSTSSARSFCNLDTGYAGLAPASTSRHRSTSGGVSFT